nr:MAG TPA: hypothetical protein [Caudoviricetes sp.]
MAEYIERERLAEKWRRGRPGCDDGRKPVYRGTGNARVESRNICKEDYR